MMQIKSLLLALVAVMSANAFAPTSTISSQRLTTPLMAVVDIDGEASFDKTVKGAGDKLVIVDYSTTWCGPCKVIAPKFDEFSEKYSDAVFLKVRDELSVFLNLKCKKKMSLKNFIQLTQTSIVMQVIGDANPDASKLMKREGVRSVPSFHYFKNGEKVDVVNGANAEAIEAAITKNM